jgi:uncharacterized membrane protein
MSCLFTLLGLLVVAFLVGPWVLTGIQYRRQREQGARLTTLEGEIARLRALVARGAPAPTAAPDTVAPIVIAEAPTVVTVPSVVAGAAPAAAATTIDALPPVGSPPADAAAAAAPPPPPGPTPPGDAGGVLPPEGRAARRIEWERWIGVRGAAVLGGIVLALAGILFVRYTIERGLISPAVRVALGILGGLASIGISQRLRARGYRINADALAGAGIVLLYAAVWAAHSLYGFIGSGATYALMGLVTVACGVLSWRNGSLLIAVLGLVGGFATPLLVESTTGDPIGLFGYVLLLDLGLIGLARRRGWSSLALLALAGTVVYQGLWILRRMPAGDLSLALLVLGVFALLFGVASWARGRGEAAPATRGWVAAEAAGLLVPFAFAMHLAGRADLSPRLAPVAVLLFILSLAAQWVGRRHGRPDLLSSGAAAGALAVVLVWSWDVDLTPSLVWEAVVICVGLTGAFHLFFELDALAARRSRALDTAADIAPDAALAPSLSNLVAGVGFLFLLVVLSFDWKGSPWPFFVGFMLVGAMLYRQSIEPKRAYTPLIAAIGVALGVTGWFLAVRRQASMPPAEIYFGVVLLLGAALQALAVARRAEGARRWCERAAAAYPSVVLLGLMVDAGRPWVGPRLFLALTVLLALLLVLAATRLGSAAAYLLGMVLVALVHSTWSIPESKQAVALLGLLVEALVVAGFALWPSFAPRLGRQKLAWRAAALAAPLWFWSMHRLFVTRFGDRAIGLLPLLLAAITLVAAHIGRRAWVDVDDRVRTGHLAFFGAVVLGLAAVAVPLQLDREWITVGWALEALAVTVLWRRLDHPGLKYFGAVLFAAVGARLLLNPEVLSYHEPSRLPVLNWLAYTYLVPAACMLGAARILATEAPSPALEARRARRWEAPFYAPGKPLFGGAFALLAIVVVFAWINLTIVDAYSTGPTLALSLDRIPARDLTMSLAWIVYAVVLLGLGMARDSGALRWLSLGFLLLSIGKVFLYDLGELRDLYRVASLVGLALTLILVSLAYQRFVFRRRPRVDAG